MTVRPYRWLAPVWGALLCASAVADPGITLRYRAFLSGAPVGKAEVTVVVTDGRYRVEGDARGSAWLKGFTDWRNRFSATGHLAGLVKELAEFSYTESDRDKHRHVIVRDGILQVTKNGKERPPRPSPSGSDVVSALFVQPHCDGDQMLHTGRHVYRLRRLEQTGGGCRYAVTDDDDDTYEVELRLVRRGGLMVPKKITVHGWLTGWVELVSDQRTGPTEQPVGAVSRPRSPGADS